MGNRAFTKAMIFYYVAIAVLCAAFLYLIRTICALIRKKQISLLEYSRSFSETGVFEGQTLLLTETIHNRSFLPMFFVDIEAYFYNELWIDRETQPERLGMQYLVSRFHLMPFMKVVRTHKIIAFKRGYYTLSGVTIFSFGREYYFNSPAFLYVYPMLCDYPVAANPLNFLQGDVTTQRRLVFDPFSLSGVREYQSGDPFNSINFKATAKNAAHILLVNKRDFSSSRVFMLYINFQTETVIPTLLYHKMIERALSQGATIVQNALESGYRVGFCANCYTVKGEMYIRYPISAGTASFEDILRSMAQIRAREGVIFTSLLERDIRDGLSGAEVLIFTAYIDQEMDVQILRMKQNTNNVSVFIFGDSEEEYEKD